MTAGYRLTVGLLSPQSLFAIAPATAVFGVLACAPNPLPAAFPGQPGVRADRQTLKVVPSMQSSTPQAPPDRCPHAGAQTPPPQLRLMPQRITFVFGYQRLTRGGAGKGEVVQHLIAQDPAAVGDGIQ